MSVKLVSLKCPSCGKALSVERGAENVFCTYCGTPLHVEQKNRFSLHFFNEAKIRKAEANEKIRLKQLEMKEREAQRKRKDQWIAVAIALLFAFAMIFIPMLLRK